MRTNARPGDHANHTTRRPAYRAGGAIAANARFRHASVTRLHVSHLMQLPHRPSVDGSRSRVMPGKVRSSIALVWLMLAVAGQAADPRGGHLPVSPAAIASPALAASAPAPAVAEAPPWRAEVVNPNLHVLHSAGGRWLSWMP